MAIVGGAGLLIIDMFLSGKNQKSKVKNQNSEVVG
jgi:hypothetical protein